MATIPAGQTKVTVTHGLGGLPTCVLLTGTHSEVKAPWVENPTASTFDIVVESPVTTDRNVYWYAVRK